MIEQTAKGSATATAATTGDLSERELALRIASDKNPKAAQVVVFGTYGIYILVLVLDLNNRYLHHDPGNFYMLCWAIIIVVQFCVGSWVSRRRINALTCLLSHPEK